MTSGLMKHRLPTILVGALWFCGAFRVQLKKQQSKADACQMIVPNTEFPYWWKYVIVGSGWLIGAFVFLSSENFFDKVGDAGAFFIQYLVCMGTFPMIAPTYKEKLAKLRDKFKKGKMSTVAAEVN